MKKIKILYLIFLLSACIKLFGQDTISVLQYNLLRYSNSTNACAPIATKTSQIKTILQYAKPDIAAFNEVEPSNTTCDYLLNNGFNTDGISHYKRGTFTNYAGSDIINILYYNSNKLSLSKQYVVQTIVRDINIFKLFYKSPELSITHDTAYIFVCVAHLKASTGTDNVNDRATMTQDLVNYLNNINIAGNYLCQGDFNLYTSDEQAYKNLIANPNLNMRFYDPINRPGAWENIASFSDIHTQSTHSAMGSCFASGGLDSRFDFILISDPVRTGSKKVKYIPGSYKAIGQDGQHFNMALNVMPNNSVPTNVINALYSVSDHLPVMLKLRINQTPASDIIETESNFASVNCFVTENDKINLFISLLKPSDLKINLISTTGQILWVNEFGSHVEKSEIEVPFNYPAGIYLLRITDDENHSIVKKVCRNR